MHAAVTAFSGRAGGILRTGTATVVASAVALATAAATGVVPTASAGDYGDDHGLTMKLSSRTTDELTDGRNYIRALGRADKDVWDGKVVLSFPIRSTYRLSYGNPVVRLAGGVAYTGAGPDVTWTRLRVNFDIDRITARINGGPRVAILKFEGSSYRGAWEDDDDALRLTRAGARSLNRAAAGAPFSAGNVYAADSSGCSD